MFRMFGLVATMTVAACVQAAVSIVPAPREFRLTGGEFSADVRKVADLPREVRTVPGLPAEGYRLVVSENGVSVESADAVGAFYALKTLEQVAEVREKEKKVVVPCLEIRDWPSYPWRGVLIDEGRHFFGQRVVQRVIDLMAEHKLNVLHWHLTEDQGWRIDIPGMPELVRYGSVRSQSPRPGSPWHCNAEGIRIMQMDGVRYGPFFYTEQEIRDVIAYAAERHVMVVPEIELPGHVAALLAAHPEFACCPEHFAKRDPRVVWGIENEVLCVGNDEAIAFFERILDWTCRTFPAPYIHIGGDECPTLRWEKCPKCLARVKSEKLEGVAGLQPWLTRRIVKFLEARGKRVLGWQDAMNGDAPLSLIGVGHGAQGPRKDGSLAKYAKGAVKGHDIIACPGDLTYFYYGQGLDDPFQYGESGQPFGGGKVTLEKAYSFDPRKGIPPEAQQRVLGSESCNWSEYTWSEHDLAWKMWPRTCALAEVLWLGDAKPGYADFIARMQTHRRRLIAAGVNCAPLGREK